MPLPALAVAMAVPIPIAIAVAIPVPVALVTRAALAAMRAAPATILAVIAPRTAGAVAFFVALRHGTCGSLLFRAAAEYGEQA